MDATTTSELPEEHYWRHGDESLTLTSDGRWMLRHLPTERAPGREVVAPEARAWLEAHGYQHPHVS